MNDYFNIAIKTSLGAINNALVHVEVFDKLLAELDFINPKEKDFLNFISKYEIQAVGNTKLKLEENGILFIDFKSMTIFNIQDIEPFPILRRPVVTDLIFRKSKLLRKYVPYITHVFEYKKKDDDYTYPLMLMKKKVKKPKNLRELFKTSNIKTSPWKLKKYEDNKIVDAGSFMIPEDDFVYFQLKLPEFNVLSYDLTSDLDINKFKEDVSIITGETISDTDNGDFYEILSDNDFKVRQDYFLKNYSTFSENEFKNLNDLATENKIFSIENGMEKVYPTFQFDKENFPIRVISDVINILGNKKSNWQLVFWFISPNVWLRGKLPIEFLDEPHKIIDAALYENEVISD